MYDCIYSVRTGGASNVRVIIGTHAYSRVFRTCDGKICEKFGEGMTFSKRQKGRDSTSPFDILAPV